MARVELRQISKSYPGVHALDDVELAIESGEFFTLLGPSGCGKTTLLRTIAGFNRQDSGEILVDGSASTTCPRTAAISAWCTRTTRSFRT